MAAVLALGGLPAALAVDAMAGTIEVPALLTATKGRQRCDRVATRRGRSVVLTDPEVLPDAAERAALAAAEALRSNVEAAV